LIVEVERGSKVVCLYEHLINTYQKYKIKKFILINPDNEKLMDAGDTLETRDQQINFKIDIDSQLMEWMKEKLETLGSFEESKHCIAELEEVAKRFLKEPSQTKLFVWLEG
jgi:hypothetical protein